MVSLLLLALYMLSCLVQWPVSLIYSRHRTAQLASDTQMVHISLGENGNKKM